MNSSRIVLPASPQFEPHPEHGPTTLSEEKGDRRASIPASDMEFWLLISRIVIHAYQCTFMQDRGALLLAFFSDACRKAAMSHKGTSWIP
ncbi:hypothetical protein [Rhabdaerophilum sp.]|uniref:hypothetical protein n=1 Tax=Rhabdaerophilum sp. TaxID=2717341 RepID=UPI0038D3A4DC